MEEFQLLSFVLCHDVTAQIVEFPHEFAVGASAERLEAETETWPGVGSRRVQWLEERRVPFGANEDRPFQTVPGNRAR